MYTQIDTQIHTQTNTHNIYTNTHAYLEETTLPFSLTVIQYLLLFFNFHVYLRVLWDL